MASYTKETLQQVIDFYFLYHPQTKDYYFIAKYFSFPETQEEKNLVRSDFFFRYTANSSWAMVILNLCKIFQKSEAQKYNLYKVFSSIKNNKENEYILEKITDKFVSEVLEKLESVQPTVKKLTTLRNKYYAHLDDLNLDLNTLDNPTFKEIEVMFDLIEEIVSELGIRIYDADYLFRDHDRIKADSIVKDVLKQRNLY